MSDQKRKMEDFLNTWDKGEIRNIKTFNRKSFRSHKFIFTNCAKVCQLSVKVEMWLSNSAMPSESYSKTASVTDQILLNLCCRIQMFKASKVNSKMLLMTSTSIRRKMDDNKMCLEFQWIYFISFFYSDWVFPKSNVQILNEK